MTYKNKYQTNLANNFIKSLTTTRFTTIILLLLIIFFITFSITTEIPETAVGKFLVTIGLFTAVTIYGIVMATFKVWPNEKSVTFNESSMTINYPYLKKNHEIPFTEINYIRIHSSNQYPESQISIKRKENTYGLTEEIATISSLNSDDWREVALHYKLPVIIHNDIEERVFKKWGFFGTKYLERNDYYVIKKSFDNKDQKIDENLWREFSNTHDKIKYLGTEELINVSEDIQKDVKHQYSIETEFGVNGIDYFDGMLVITYEKNKKPNDLEIIARGINSELRNINDIN